MIYSSTSLEAFREVLRQLFLIVFSEKSLANHSDLLSNDFYLLENGSYLLANKIK